MNLLSKFESVLDDNINENKLIFNTNDIIS
jgi:hypothetical protein